MAYDKIIPIRSRLDRCLSYTLNQQKTGLEAALDYSGNPAKTYLTTGINCRPDTAFWEMRETKRRWDKQGGVLGYHIIHSYAPGEVAPEEAHAAGVEFARRLLGERYEAVVSTHIDRSHLHCHIVFNSVSFADGRKYRSDFQSYFHTLRDASNGVSRERGLSVIQPEGHGRHYAEWNAGRQGKPTLRGMARQDIDAAIRESFTWESFLAALGRQGYLVKAGPSVKHTAVTPPGGQRAVRLDNLGEGYTEADIRARLAEAREGKAPEPPRPYLPPRRYRICKGNPRQRPLKKAHGFRALYLYYLILLSGPRKRPPPFPVRAEAVRLDRYRRQFVLLQKYRIDSGGQLTMLEDALQAKIDGLTDARKNLYREKRAGLDVDSQIQKINLELRQLRRELKACGQIKTDIPRIRGQVRQVKRPEQTLRQKHHWKTAKMK